ncbi:Serine phosphatase RsbU, regulator of sigma subunit [Amycolatopsis pretoriensis]|uniref:Serine phosphatase RsbU, regulator of sigma subunit n=2 Tax=Amycolatopsis pretoriensis TaxID=218821 RepID=A0A1H5Q281_9PSEU|nr:PP2C family protein-serine/threonine phosphatase [Amycolatopsis pretoriensis]SEF20200.1 Serine phosphatase RsbU, regulator of sigma subunit [Amycolatopsis pretoriensis]
MHDHLARLRRELRTACGAAGVPADDRARLVLAVTLLAEPAFAAGEPVDVTTVAEGHRLAVTVRFAHAVSRRRRDELPLLPEAGADGTLTWHLTGGRPATEPADLDDEPATRAEMLALVARADKLTQEQRDLKHELAETNSGVLAMYVDLEQRDEQLRRAHAHIFRELEDALRPPPPVVPGLELAVHYSPTGGDLYDWFVLPGGDLHVTLVDAVGHGVTSTRHALTVTHAIRTLALEGHPFPDLIAHTARTLAAIEPGLMATVLLARVDPVTGRTRLANGSHPEPLLVTAAGDARLLPSPLIGRGIGFPDPGSRRLVEVDLAPGDTLLLYTDGLVESRKDIDEGQARLLPLARDLRTRPAAVLPRELVARMHDFVTYADDTVAIALRRG